MNGIIIVNKEKNFTSFDVVRQIRRIFKTKKVGHLGTLDPLATGVLVVTINDATKLAPFIENVDKTYIATILIGKSTTTYDEEGEVTEVKPITELSHSKIMDAFCHFIGKSMQYPPIYSAIKKNGKKLYEYAREGIDIKLEPREIEIKEMKLLSEVVFQNGECEFSFEVTVSKGTYIRSLCKDIAEYLGYPGYMKELCRIKSGNFTLEQASTITDIEKGNYHLIDMLEAMNDFPIIESEALSIKAKNGMKISIADIKKHINEESDFVVIQKDQKLLAIYKQDETCYKAVRVWN